MDSYYFLHTGSLCDINYDIYKSGLMALNSLSAEMQAFEIRIKNSTVYDNPLYEQLCVDYAETDVILKFIEQCRLVTCEIDNDASFCKVYPNEDAGFLGVNFNGTVGIADYRKVVDTPSLVNCRNKHLERLIKVTADKELPTLLKLRYPNYIFTIDALKDFTWWKHNRIDIVDVIIRLLDDIPAHPHAGGMGKTEVLSHTTIPVASKRITHGDRLTYTFGKTTTIHRCKEHY